MATQVSQLANDTDNFAAIQKIVVMENDSAVRDEIIETLRDVGCAVRTVFNADQALQLAETNKARFFIIDIRMGDDPKRIIEGLNALEQIKNVDPTIFVAIYSGYPEWYRQQAENLRVDVFVEKSDDLRGDIITIVAKMLPRALELYKRWPNGDDPEDMHEDEDSSEEFAVNYDAYMRFINNEKQFNENLGYFVAFIDGEMAGRDKDRDNLILGLSAQFPNESKFYALVEEEETIEDVPSAIFDDF